MRRDADAVVVGGGPAGAAAAIRLAETGRGVVLFERERSPHHKVCGEFVSVEAVRCLEALGVDLAGLGGVPVEHMRLIAGRRVAEARLPFAALSVSRERLDDALLTLAARQGVDVRRGRAVRTLMRDDGGDVRAVCALGEAVTAAVGFLATGKHDLRGHRRPEGVENDLIGFKMHLELRRQQAALLDGHVEVVLFPGGYAGLQPVAGGRANLCLLVGKAAYERLGQCWETLLGHIAVSCPVFADRIAGARPCWERPLSIYGIPYGFVHQAGMDGCRSEAVYRIGDQLAVIPSFCGDGMAIALHSARRAVEHYLGGETAPFDGAEYRAQIRTAMMVSRAIRMPALHGPMVEMGRIIPSLLAGLASRTRVPGG